MAEFIEDCDYAKLSVRILSLLGKQGPTSHNPSKYIRGIYNRVILEVATVRAAAVSALAMFAVAGDQISRNRILILLERCTDDIDDEVRDRACFYVSILQNPDSPLGGQLSLEFVSSESSFEWQSLESHLAHYISTKQFSKPFDISQIASISASDEQDMQMGILKHYIEKRASTMEIVMDEVVVSKKVVNSVAADLDIPGLNNLGPIFKSSPRIALTEPETEYVVTLIKHTYQAHLVLQVILNNLVSNRKYNGPCVPAERRGGFRPD